MRRQISTYSGLSLVALVFNFLDILAHGRSESELLQELAPQHLDELAAPVAHQRPQRNRAAPIASSTSS